MGHEELDEHEIPLRLAARALGVSSRTVGEWIANGDLKAEQTTVGRWWLKVADCRAFLRGRCGPNSRAEQVFDAVLLTGDLPPSPFTLPEVQIRDRGMVPS